MTRWLFGLVAISAAMAQPRFEAASVKPSAPGVRGSSMTGGPLPIGPYNHSGKDPGRIRWTNMRLGGMIQVAYDLRFDQVSGPAWLYTNCYDVVATIPPGTSIDSFRAMVRTLLAERFQLAAHRETKEVSGFAVEAAKGGPKLKPSQPGRDVDPDPGKPVSSSSVIDKNGYAAPRPGGPGYARDAPFEANIQLNGTNRVTVLNEPMPAIAAFLGRLAFGAGVDRTGLSGNYDLHLKYVPRPGNSGGSEPAAPAPGPDVFDAIQDQLGLKLVPGKVPFETLVIDHAEKVPVGN